MMDQISNAGYTLGYQHGMQDYDYGLQLTQNPYPRNTTEHLGWEDGWLDADRNDYFHGDQE